jgi:septum formation protein
MRLVLASASPARLALLTAAGVAPEVMVSGIREDHLTGPAADVTLELATQKARTVANRVANRVADEALVVGCDSLLELSGVSYGKPADSDGVRKLWRAMRGQQGTLYTGHCAVRIPADRQMLEAAAVSSTIVRFGRPSDDEVEAYIATGEPTRVAGAFTLDRYGGWFVDGIDGDPGTVLGLSLPLLRELFSRVGVAVTDLWPSRVTAPAPPAVP